jgi:acyl-CoA synthetase (AMP-forming)/AMP-acid ligase II/aryl carrier-like protein
MYAQPLLQRARSISEVLRRQAAEKSIVVALRFQSETSSAEQAITYGELDRRSRVIGGWLQSIGAADRPVVLVFPPGLDYVAALFGTLYAGAIAVPLPPPKLNDRSAHLVPVLADVDCHAVLAASSLRDRVAGVIASLPRQPPAGILSSDDLPHDADIAWSEPAAGRDSLAVLQYTSGSTATPKGVMISHGNLLHNISLMAEVSRLDEESIGVSWLPHFHDMGLVGGILMPICVGFPTLLMSPSFFLMRPLRWLEAISRCAATVSGGPNFAYDLCVRKIADEERSSVDLSSWRVAYSGSEPIRSDTITRFADAFAPSGFRRSSFFPCYGLAEATLMVSGGAAGESPRSCRFTKRGLAAGCAVATSEQMLDSVEMVSSGALIAEQKVIIVDPERKEPCSDGGIGEIWVSGASVGAGYWNRGAESRDAFAAYLAESGQGPFLRTGDLGFIRDGKLFVTGRQKDVIIIRGLNHHPQDIEHTLEHCHEALRPGCCVAFSVDAAGEESLVVALEVDRASIAQATPIFRGIAQAVAEHHEMQVHAIALVKRGAIPKTTSGKVQRQRCRAAFLAGDLPVLCVWRADAASLVAAHQPSDIDTNADTAGYRAYVRAVLIAELAALLDIAPHRIDPRLSIYALGLDSLKAAQLRGRVELKLGTSLELLELIARPTIEDIATEIALHPASPQRQKAADATRRLIERIDQLSEQEVAAILEAEKETIRAGTPE